MEPKKEGLHPRPGGLDGIDEAGILTDEQAAMVRIARGSRLLELGIPRNYLPS